MTFKIKQFCAVFYSKEGLVTQIPFADFRLKTAES